MNKEQAAKKSESKAARQQAYETGTLMDKVSYYILEGVDYVSEVSAAAASHTLRLRAIMWLMP